MEKHARKGLVGRIQVLSHSLAGAIQGLTCLILMTQQPPVPLPPPGPSTTPRSSNRSFSKSIFGRDSVQCSHPIIFLTYPFFHSSILLRTFISINLADTPLLISFVELLISISISICRERDTPFDSNAASLGGNPNEFARWGFGGSAAIKEFAATELRSILYVSY